MTEGRADCSQSVDSCFIRFLPYKKRLISFAFLLLLYCISFAPLLLRPIEKQNRGKLGARLVHRINWGMDGCRLAIYKAIGLPKEQETSGAVAPVLQLPLSGHGCRLLLAGRVVVVLFRVPPFYTGHLDLFNCLSFFSY